MEGMYVLVLGWERKNQDGGGVGVDGPGARWKSEKGGVLDCDSCLKSS